jgi:hypothetical protein
LVALAGFRVLVALPGFRVVVALPGFRVLVALAGVDAGLPMLCKLIFFRLSEYQTNRYFSSDASDM